MRINVYSEELTPEVELVTKHVEDEEFGHRTFYGLRFYLDSPDSLHHSPDDDDRSAVTLWVKWTKREGTDTGLLKELLDGLMGLVAQVDEATLATIRDAIEPSGA